MRVCTCPECGEPLRITCPSNHARASAGVLEVAVTPQTLAARRPARPPATFQARGGSATAVLLQHMPVGVDMSRADVVSLVQRERPGTTSNNIDQSLYGAVRAGVLTRVRAGVYRRVAA